MDLSFQLKLVDVLIGAPLFLLSLVFHEYCHALAATRLGDNTAAWSGRLTLNPVVHIDLIGSIVMPLVGMWMGGFIFGWAKPVPFNPRNLRNAPRDTMIIALAGPLANLALVLVFAAIARALMMGGLPLHPITHVVDGRWVVTLNAWSMLHQGLTFGIFINVLLAVFNMIPLPPLDGSKVLAYFLDSGTAARLLRFNPMLSFFIIIMLFQTPLLRLPLTVLRGLGEGLGGL
jgi:Zn-dependent protease